MQELKLKGIYEKRINKRKSMLLTKNLDVGRKVYQEKLFTTDDGEFREWMPERSKLAAAIKKGITQIGIKPESIVLYLGASTGTTPSHVSDIVGGDGFVFALDFAPRVVRELVFLCERRGNMAPILANANKPKSYLNRVSMVDVVYQDIAQRDQLEIFIKNVNLFLKKGGFGLLCIKARSIDVTKKPKEIFKQVRAKLEKEMIVADYRELEPFEKDHCIFICKKR